MFLSVFCSCHSHFVSVACSVARRTAVAPACMRKPSPSKWCRAQHTAPHLAAPTGSGNAAPHRRWDVRTLRWGAIIHISCCLCWLCFSPLAFIQSIRQEEKEIYRQLLTMVSGGQSSCVHNGSSHTIVRSHRDLYVYLNPTSRNFILPLLEVVYKNKSTSFSLSIIIAALTSPYI